MRWGRKSRWQQPAHSRIYGGVERDRGDQDPFPFHLSEQRQGLPPLVRFAAGVDRRVKSIPVWLAHRISCESVDIERVEYVCKIRYLIIYSRYTCREVCDWSLHAKVGRSGHVTNTDRMHWTLQRAAGPFSAQVKPKPITPGRYCCLRCASHNIACNVHGTSK